MPKRSKDRVGNTRRSGGAWMGFPTWTSRGRSVTARRREALNEVSGTPYDRDPCPHSLRTKEVAVAATDPIRVGDVITYETRCERPAGHVRERADALRVHADAAGRTWS
jgi:hypothetical protein